MAKACPATGFKIFLESLGFLVIFKMHNHASFPRLEFGRIRRPASVMIRETLSEVRSYTYVVLTGIMEYFQSGRRASLIAPKTIRNIIRPTSPFDFAYSSSVPNLSGLRRTEAK